MDGRARLIARWLGWVSCACTGFSLLGHRRDADDDDDDDEDGMEEEDDDDDGAAGASTWARPPAPTPAAPPAPTSFFNFGQLLTAYGQRVVARALATGAH